MVWGKLKTKAIIVDLDGCFSNSDHRKHLVENLEEGQTKNWPLFYRGLIKDKPNAWCVDLISGMYLRNIIPLYVTSRSEAYRQITLDWFHLNFDSAIGVFSKKYVNAHLYMRPTKDRSDDFMVKQKIYEEQIKNTYEIVFAIDDRKRICDMWRGLGLTCLACAEGNF